MTIATIKTVIPSAPFEAHPRGAVLTYLNDLRGGVVCRNKSPNHRHAAKGVSFNYTKGRVVSRHFAEATVDYIVESPNGCRWKVNDEELR